VTTLTLYKSNNVSLVLSHYNFQYSTKITIKNLNFCDDMVYHLASYGAIETINLTTVELTMSKKSPWHSIKQNVHHNNTECNTGKNIERENVRSGTGGKPLCQECAKLNSQGR